MSKVQGLKAKYVADADMMASKSRFGFFTLPPSHTATHTDFAHTARTVFLIQHIEMPMEKSLANLQTSTVELLLKPACRKITFLTLLQPSMAPNIKILGRMSGKNKPRRQRDKKEKTSSDLLSLTRLCMH